MEIKDLQGKLIAVLGYGTEGKAVAAYLIKHGINPVLFDVRPWDAWADAEKEQIRALGLNFIFGPDYLDELKGFNVAFRSPGLPRLHPKLMEQEQKGMVITSQTKWFFEHCPAKIAGVTGTKGKGTTSSLIFEILQFQSKISNPKSKIFLTGNIGKQQPLEFLDDLTVDDWVVYELSSFQLQDLDRSPHIGVVLMVTQEHLDHHKTAEEYREAKTPIVKFQTAGDFAVVNADFDASVKIGEQGKGQKYLFSRTREAIQGCFVRDGQMVIKDIGGENFQIPVSSFQLRGRHNWENICAAAAAAILAGAGEDSVKSVIAEFKGLQHRLEFVADKNGIKFYNDSFSTTPETAIAAIESFTEPLVLILGGSSKNSDFTALGQAVVAAKNIKALILIGQEAGRIKTAIDKAGNFGGAVMEGANSMAEIFQQVKSAAKNGDIVLLSPACASFGMFLNYKDRGEQFKTSVQSF